MFEHAFKSIDDVLWKEHGAFQFLAGVL